MQTSLQHPSSRLAPLALGCAYFLMAALALASSRFEGGLAFIWGANALLMAYLLTSRAGAWPCALIVCGVARALSTALSSEARRVGKEGVRTGVSGWSAVP